MLEKLRIKSKQLEVVDKEKYSVISKILADDNCFFNMDIETSYSILKDLGVDDIQKVYLELMKRK